jgi:hypothetical protein
MKKHLTILIAAIALVFSVTFSEATPLVQMIKGADLVNAAKFVLDRKYTPASDLDKMLSVYALGFIEGAIVSDTQREVTEEVDRGHFDLGSDGTIGVLKTILEHVDGSPTLTAADGAPLLHGLLCVRYGTTHNMRMKGTNIILGLSAKEGRKLLDKIEDTRKKQAEQDGAGQPATRPESKSEGGDKPRPEAEGRSR